MQNPGRKTSRETDRQAGSYFWGHSNLYLSESSVMTSSVRPTGWFGLLDCVAHLLDFEVT